MRRWICSLRVALRICLGAGAIVAAPWTAAQEVPRGLQEPHEDTTAVPPGSATTDAPSPADEAADPTTAENPEPVPAWRAAVDRGDAAWERRAEGQRDGRADPAPVGEAVEAYEEALAEVPDRLEVRWKLLRALYFQGDFTTTDLDRKKDIFGRGREVCDGALDLLAPEVGGRDELDDLSPEEIAEAFAGRDEVGYVFYWGAISWGLWGDAYGKMAAARQGVGKKIREYAQVAIALIPDYEYAGGHRLLGRLHSEAPKIPFFTGWVDRDTAISELRIAAQAAPEELYNRVYLAEALLRFDKKKKDEALGLLRAVLATEPRPFKLVEDTKILRDARTLLKDAEE